MAEEEVLTHLLAIPHYEGVGVTFGKACLTLDIHSTIEGGIWPRCGQFCIALHENHARLVRDLPMSGKACYLRFVRRRFFCSHWGRPFSEPLEFVEDHREYTRRYQAWIFQQVKENNLASVQRLEGLTFDQSESIFVPEARDRIPPHPFANLKRLGIDEIAMRKGKQNFVLILTNLDTGEVAEVLEKRTQEKLRSRLTQLAEEERAHIEEVAIDMWERIPRCGRNCCPTPPSPWIVFTGCKRSSKRGRRGKLRKRSSIPKP